MQVRKRNGSLEDVNLDKITSSVRRCCNGLEGVDFEKIAYRTVGGLYDGVSTKELDELSIQTAVGFIAEDPVYSKVAARLLANYVAKEVENQEIYSFSQSISIGFEHGLISQNVFDFVMNNKRKLNALIEDSRNKLFEYYGLRIVYDRYLLKHPTTRKVIETPQYFLMRVACGLVEDVKEANEFYSMLSELYCMASTPTLFNSGTAHSQMSSCYLLDSPIDCIEDIEKRKSDIAQLSKWAGGIGLNYSRVRGAGALIKGTNGISNGIVPFLHSMSANVAAWNQGGRRKGAACVYLEPHHPDLMEFLELRDNTGDHEKRAYNLNLANWIPDLFMKRVLNDETWSFFDPTVAPELSDIFGEEYERRYLELEEKKLYKKQLPARVIYHRMMKTIAETGNGWINFKDTSNRRGNSAVNGNIIRSSNLCTEILEPTSCGRYEEFPIEQMAELHYKASHDEINCNIIGVDWERGIVRTIMDAEVSVCNLQSINLARHVKNGKIDWERLAKTTKTAVKYLDRVIDRNFYPIHEARASNMRWRPIGLGLMGWQDVLFQLRIPFESAEATELARRVSEEVYYSALKASCDLAKLHGPHRDFDKTHAAQGRLQMDLAGHADAVTDPERWEKLRAEIRRSGLRNSLLIAVAPTVTISAISGCYECIEPQISNYFKRETLTGEFVTINKYLVEDLKSLGLWDETMRNRIKDGDGSVQHIEEIPEEMRQLYKTAWEVKQKSIIDQMIQRCWFIDQSASMNLFVENPTIEKLSSMYMYCWRNGDGVKTSYYLRSKSATKINRTTGLRASSEPMTAENTTVAQPDLENPEVCESCT